MKRCIICKRESSILYDGICKKCLGEGANVSLMSSISDKDDEMVKRIEQRASEGKIVRLM